MAGAVVIAWLAVATALGGGVQRDDVLQQGAAYVYHRWQMSEANAALPARCARGSKRYASPLHPGPQVGVAYAWGAWMSIDEFDRRIQDGFAAGSHRAAGDVEACVAGVDCSGFVSMLWHLDRKRSTADLPAITDPVALADLQPGDVLNDAGSHVVVFLGRDARGEVVFMEAAGVGRVRIHSGWSYVHGYEPRRYRGISSDPAHGTVSAPFPVASLPFRDVRRPLAVGPDALAHFACASGEAPDDGFGQALYRLAVASASRLTVTASGPDRVALRLLSAPEASACVAQGQDSLDRRVEAGAWYVSVQADPTVPVTLEIEAAAEPEPEPLPEVPGADDTDVEVAASQAPSGWLLLLGAVIGALVAWWRERRR